MDQEYFVVLTVENTIDTPAGRATVQQTVTRIASPGPDATTAGLYGWALDQMRPEVRGGHTLHFSVTPNELGA